jgi:hypothetical protein
MLIEHSKVMLLERRFKQQPVVEDISSGKYKQAVQDIVASYNNCIKAVTINLLELMRSFESSGDSSFIRYHPL